MYDFWLVSWNDSWIEWQCISKFSAIALLWCANGVKSKKIVFSSATRSPESSPFSCLYQTGGVQCLFSYEYGVSWHHIDSELAGDSRLRLVLYNQISTVNITCPHWRHRDVSRSQSFATFAIICYLGIVTSILDWKFQCPDSSYYCCYRLYRFAPESRSWNSCHSEPWRSGHV